MPHRDTAVPRSVSCSCCHRQGARFLVRLDENGSDQVAVCPGCDARASDHPGWTDADSTDPRRGNPST